jgi:hypothetical protein
MTSGRDRASAMSMIQAGCFRDLKSLTATSALSALDL